MVTEPEGYESPPVASRFRANEQRAGSGAPSSEFWSRPPAKVQPSAEAPTVDEHEHEHEHDPEIVARLAKDAPTNGAVVVDSGPMPPGGPRFVGAAPVPQPAGRWRRRARHGASNGAALGTFRPAWTMPVPSRARRLRPLLIPLMVLVVLAAAGYLAYSPVRTFIRSRSAPAVLRSYVKGHGVTYTPVGQGYSVRLPVVPVHRDQQVTSSDGKRSMLVRRSIAAGTDYQIVIRVDELAKNTKLPAGLPGALQDPFLAGSDAPATVHKTVIAGETAYEGQVHAHNVLPFSTAVFMHGGRLYVIRVQSRSVGVVLDAVAKSFRFKS